MVLDISKDESVRNFPGRTFVNALEEYTRRIEIAVTEIENGSESTLGRVFALLVFLLLAAGIAPISVRVAEEFPISTSYKIFLQATVFASVVTILGLTFFTIYTRTLRLRRHRRNLETLIWPYQKLLQKLSQIVDHGDLDEGTSTLIQLKILEAEVAYGRARRIVEGSGSLASLFFPHRQRTFEAWEARQLTEEFGIPLQEAERLLVRYWPDRERVRAEASERSRFPHP